MRRTGLAAVVALVAACRPTGYQASFSRDPAAVDAKADFLKCHTADGHLYVFAKWTIGDGRVNGVGRLYDADRRFVSEGSYVVALGDVALFETNRPELVSRSAAGYVVLGIVTVGLVGITAFCATNPKACFGSCPTFYVKDGGAWRIEAEGFSASVAKPLEETDVDAMWTARPTSRELDVQMANEALETHLVDHVRVLAASRPAGTRVYRSGARYLRGSPPLPPASCSAEGADCLGDVRAIDDLSHLAAADPNDLATKETIALSFARPRGQTRLGLALAARNSLMNTFVFYQGLAYAGTAAGRVWAKLESSNDADAAAMAGDSWRLGHALGGIEVEVEDEAGAWRHAGVYDEVGPIAREVQLVELPAVGGDALHVRLTMTKGYFKLDHAGLVALEGEVVPIAIEPARVLKDGRDDEPARARLRPGGARLATYPGDVYTLRFELPPGDQELFLESRGYYVEWMRDTWLPEESPLAAASMLADPAGAMRRLAPAYKRIEDRMEAILFWNTRVGVRR